MYIFHFIIVGGIFISSLWIKTTIFRYFTEQAFQLTQSLGDNRNNSVPHGKVEFAHAVFISLTKIQFHQQIIWERTHSILKNIHTSNFLGS